MKTIKHGFYQICFPSDNSVINAAQDTSAWPSFSPQCIADCLGSHEDLWEMDRTATMELLVSKYMQQHVVLWFLIHSHHQNNVWNLGKKLPETFGFRVQSAQPSDFHWLSQTNNNYKQKMVLFALPVRTGMTPMEMRSLLYKRCSCHMK